MEQFKASEEDWQLIEKWLDLPHANLTRAVVELRDRVAALEAAPDRVLVRNQIGEYVKPRTPLFSYSTGEARPLEECGKDHAVLAQAAAPPAAVPSDEDLWELAREAKKQVTPHFNWSTWDEPHGPDFGHFVAAHRALHDCGFQHGLAAGRAEQGGTPEPEPNQAPAGDGGLVEEIWDLLEHNGSSAARDVVRMVTEWLRSRGNHYAATELEREAQR
jgi:hypothetical protein